MLIIRLQRTGKKHQPFFRIVLAEKQKSASKKFLEILGNYNPRKKEFSIKDEERLKYWLGQNVEVSPTVHNLLVSNNIVEETKVKAWQPKVKEKNEAESQPAAKSEEAPAVDKEANESAVEPEAKEAEEPKEETKTEEASQEEVKEEAKPEETAEEQAK